MMTALCDRPMPADPSARSNWGIVKPPKASPPILRKSRRETPSQNRPSLRPAMVSMKSHPHRCRAMLFIG